MVSLLLGCFEYQMLMKTKIINMEHLKAIWDAGVKNILFPDALVNKLNPQKIIDAQGDNFPAIRESRRAEIDAVIEELISSDTPEMLSARLLEIDPMIVALYFDRIQAATFALGSADSEIVEIPESWYTLISFLLQQKLFQ